MQLGYGRVLGAAGILLVLASQTARAQESTEDQAARLRSEGQAIAKEDRFADAVAKFEQSDALLPRAENQCLIALAYHRQGRVDLADAYLGECRQRGSASDPAPSWAESLGAEIKASSAAGAFGSLTVTVEPSDMKGAAFSISGWPATAWFTPREIRLPAGTYEVSVRADGHPVVSQPVTVESNQSATLPFDLTPKSTPSAQGGGVMDLGHQSEAQAGGSNRRLLSYVALGTGAAALTAGVTFHVLAYKNRGRMERAVTLPQYQKHESRFDKQRIGAYAGYGMAAIASAVGVYLWLDASNESMTAHGQASSGMASQSGFHIGGFADGESAWISLEVIH